MAPAPQQSSNRRFTLHASRFTSSAPRLTPHVPGPAPYASRLTPHVPGPSPHASRLTPHASRPSFHASRLTSLVSRLTLHGMLLVLLCVIGAACSTTAPTGKVLFEDPRGTVSLQTISDRSIQASHPINLEPALLTQLLTGIELHDEGGGEHHVKGMQTLIEGKAALTYPLFSENQVQFLAPLIAEALRKATPTESVEFRLVTTIEGSNRFQSATKETTTGSLYAYGRQLYVILTQYNYNPMLANLSFTEASHRSQDPLDYSGLKYRTLRFTPKAALRTDSPDPPTMDKQTDRFLAVDYQLLQQAWRNLEAKKQAAPQVDGKALEAARAAEAQARAAEAQARTAEAQARNTAEAQARAAEAQARNTAALAQEVETLKKQLESIQKQLGGQK